MVTIDPFGSSSKVARWLALRSENYSFLELHLNFKQKDVQRNLGVIIQVFSSWVACALKGPFPKLLQCRAEEGTFGVYVSQNVRAETSVEAISRHNSEQPSRRLFLSVFYLFFIFSCCKVLKKKESVPAEGPTGSFRITVKKMGLLEWFSSCWYVKVLEWPLSTI